VHISKNQHVFKSILAPTLVTAPTFKFLRIFECPKEHVPKRNIREIICVMAELMMHAMRFGPLENKTEPSGSLDIPMIEEFADCDKDSVIASGADAAPK
jgi:hypothetical protein